MVSVIEGALITEFLESTERAGAAEPRKVVA
jgi:hypothetical protein